MDVVPVRLVNWETGDNGLIILLRPKFRNKLLTKYLVPRLKHPNYKINLDEFGSFVWQRCNGTSNVFEIAEELRTKFSNQIEPVYERLGSFIQQLERYKLIRYEISS